MSPRERRVYNTLPLGAKCLFAMALDLRDIVRLATYLTRQRW